MVKISVGSANPVKIKSCETIAKKVWQNIEVVNYDVDSGVSDMPMNDEESIKGAINRARGAREQGDADYGFGLEFVLSHRESHQDQRHAFCQPHQFHQ